MMDPDYVGVVIDDVWCLGKQFLLAVVVNLYESWWVEFKRARFGDLETLENNILLILKTSEVSSKMNVYSNKRAHSRI